jgi:hypothetical protein
MGSTATGIGAVFNNPSDDFGVGLNRRSDGFNDF